jgi:hypothetical protein
MVASPLAMTVITKSNDAVVLSFGLVPDTDDDTLSQLAVPRDPWGDLRTTTALTVDCSWRVAAGVPRTSALRQREGIFVRLEGRDASGGGT